MATTKKTEVAVKEEGALAFSQEAPAYLNQGSARGSEEVKASDSFSPDSKSSKLSPPSRK